MKKAIFLDRDGVINKKKDDYVKSVDELEIFSFTAESIKKINRMGYLTIVVTNQSAIHRGLLTHDSLKKIHNMIQNHLNNEFAHIDAFYYCPHLPSENCKCRKPKTGQIEQALSDFDIDLKNSWVIGDSESDMEVGRTMNCYTLKIDEKFNLSNAVEYIMNNRHLR